MTAFVNASFRSEDGEKESDLPSADWRETELAAQAAMVAELATRSGDDYISAEEIARATHVVGDCFFSEKEKFDQSKASIVEAVKWIKPDWWMSGTDLKLWVARANGLLG